MSELGQSSIVGSGAWTRMGIGAIFATSIVISTIASGLEL